MEEKLPSPSIALAAYAEAFLSGRRVVIFGDSLSGLAEQLVDRGARLVQVYDPQSRRVAEATACNTSRQVSFALLSQAGVPSRDGAFDVAIVDDLASLPDARQAVALLRQVLSARGVGLIVSPNADLEPRFGYPRAPEASSYYDLYDLACSEFDEVRMLGQAPFVGFALADFSPEADDEFSIDTALVPGGAEEPEWYVALVSHFPVACSPFSVVQLPAAQLLQQVNSPRRLRGELRAAQKRAEQLEQRLAALQAPPPPKPDQHLQEQLRQARLELERRDAWVKELEARATTADARADEAEARADEAEERLSTAQARADEIKARADEAEQQLSTAQARADETKARADEAEERLSTAQLRAEATARRVAELEDVKRQLVEAREALQRARAELEQLRQRETEQRTLLDTRAGEQRELEAFREQTRRLSEQLAQQKEQNQQLRQDLKAHSAEALALEQQLVDRSKQVRELQRALGATERFAEQLLRELEDAQEAAGEAEPSAAAQSLEARVRKLESQLDGLAQTDAQRVADLTAARWTIAELENKLAGQEALDTSETERELELARAQLQHQATLLKQHAEKTRA